MLTPLRLSCFSARFGRTQSRGSGAYGGIDGGMQGPWIERITIICDGHDANVVIVSFKPLARANGTIYIMVSKPVMA